MQKEPTEGTEPAPPALVLLYSQGLEVSPRLHFFRLLKLFWMCFLLLQPKRLTSADLTWKVSSLDLKWLFLLTERQSWNLVSLCPVSGVGVGVAPPLAMGNSPWQYRGGGRCAGLVSDGAPGKWAWQLPLFDGFPAFQAGRWTTDLTVRKMHEVLFWGAGRSLWRAMELEKNRAFSFTLVIPLNYTREGPYRFTVFFPSLWPFFLSPQFHSF